MEGIRNRVIRITPDRLAISHIATCQHMQPISLAMPLASHVAHTQFYLPAHATNVLGNTTSQPHSSYPFVSTGSQFPQECHWPPYSSSPTLSANTCIQFLRNIISQPHSSYPILFASGMPLTGHIAHTRFYMQPISLEMPLDSHIAHTQFYL